MKGIDYLILILLGGYCLYVLIRLKKKKSGCFHECSSCTSACQLKEATKILKK